MDAAAHTADEKLHDGALQLIVAKLRAQRAIDPRRDRSRYADARVDRTRVVIGTPIRLFAAEDPLRGGVQAIEIDVRADRIDRPGLAHQLRRDHLRTRTVLRLGREHEPRIAREVGMALVIVMIDPRREPIAEPREKRLRRQLERDARADRRGERDVQHDHAPLQLLRLGEHARRREHELRQVHAPP